MTKAKQLRRLSKKVAQCQACPLHMKRIQTVFGVGDPDADFVIVGEAPGAFEDVEGKPFVGRAGKLLDQMLKKLQLPREDIYITNIVKCRPPGNCDPKPEEVSACKHFLDAQLEILDPLVVVPMGKFAAQTLAGIEVRSLGALAGGCYKHVHATAKSHLVCPTYHPAYVLRNRKMGKVVMKHLRAAARLAKEK